jgi:sporulation protein YhbH
MVRKIEQDSNRFRQIVRGAIRKDLRKYMSRAELIGRKGKYLVSIPLPQVHIPHFRYGSQESGGVGQGEGEPGAAIGSEAQGPGTGPGAGNMPGEHILEVDVTLEELAKILGEELELPRIQPRGASMVTSDKSRYSRIRRTGPESLRHFKRTYKEALKRQMAMGTYDPKNPVIIPVKEDRRYLYRKVTHRPQSNAVIVYMMDVSGSMGAEQKEIVRTEAFWIDTWLRYNYKTTETRYIAHDAAAREIDEETFYHLRESGGTRISSAYDLCAKIVDKDYSPEEWNIYPFHFSDGDNWGSDDTQMCVNLLKDKLLPKVNLFCYAQVKSAYGSGKFIKDLAEAFPAEENLATSEVNSRDEIMDSIRLFLGKGK